MGHEPLRPSRIFSRESHADRAAFIRHLVYFAPDRITGPAVAIASRIAVLNYKVWYYTVYRDGSEVTAVCQLDEVINGEWRIVRQKLNGK